MNNVGVIAEEQNHWALNSLQVQLQQHDGERYEASRELVSESHWQLVYMLDGNQAECMVDNSGHHFHLHVPQGHCSLRYLPRGVRVADCSPAVRRTQLQIKFTEPELLGQGMLRQEAETASRSGVLSSFDVTVNTRMQQFATAIFNLKQKNANVILPVLSNALGLLHQVVLGREVGQMSAQEREKQAIEAACRIMETNLDNPPSLEELAAQVGMSLTSFKTTFNRICGMPPFAWLRDQRLEKARCLLQHDGLRVTEVALEVGYSNFSHFTKIFEARFGVIPSRFRQEVAVRLAALICGIQLLTELV